VAAGTLDRAQVPDAGVRDGAAAERLVDVLEAGVPEWAPPPAPGAHAVAAADGRPARFGAGVARLP